MNALRPEALLKSALEKIVYFEARSEQLQRDGDSFRLEVERLQGELAQASQREIELRRLVAELEVRSTRAHREREEAARVAEALRRERAELIGKILEASAIHGADGEGESSAEAFDLARFIAELRSEVLREGQGERAAPSPAPPAAVEQSPSPLARMAQQLQEQGRLTVSPAQAQALEGAQPFAGRTEETLFGFSVRELSAPDARARIRAAERLKALGHAAAAPALATALHGEREAEVVVALLESFAAFAHAEGVPVVTPHLASPVPQVRISALKALLTLDAAQASPHLKAAMADPDRAVRRRASLLALSLEGDAALTLGEEALRDGSAEVRALGALVLGASGHAAARGALLHALNDGEERVRRAAAQSLSRILGCDVSAVVTMDIGQRRREVRRLAGLPAQPVLAAPRQAREALAREVAVRAQLLHAEASAPQAPARSQAPSAAAEHGAVLHAAADSAQARLSPSLHAAAEHAQAQARATSSLHAAAEHTQAQARATSSLHAAAQRAQAQAPATSPLHAAPELAQAQARATSPLHAAVEHPQAQEHTLSSASPAQGDASTRAAPMRRGAAAIAAMASGARVAVLEAPAAQADEDLTEPVLLELRMALRGKPLDDVAKSLGHEVAAVMRTVSTLMERGAVVRRGTRYFVA